MASPTRGLLLLNLGTPDAPTPAAVRRYLREFLSDERVLDIHPIGRWLLLNLVILPFRPARSAAAYRKVWLDGGSPLLVHSAKLRDEVAQTLDGEFSVELAMRYGTPSIAHALERLRARGVRSLTVLPLYPQYAASSTGSSLEAVYARVGELWNVLPLRVAPPFFNHPGFLEAFADIAGPYLEQARPDHVLFSFHGLPERHLRKSDPSGAHCFAGEVCCERLVEANHHCYRAQSFATAHGLAGRLGLSPDNYSVTFQSRLGRTPWVRPYTDIVIPELPGRGIKRLAVLCPSFVADCLETLEEIGIRARESFLAAGGEELTLVPSLNAHPAWVRAVVDIARSA